MAIHSCQHGPTTFAVSGASYDSFVGRCARPLAERFADVAGVSPGQAAVDIGCGPAR